MIKVLFLNLAKMRPDMRMSISIKPSSLIDCLQKKCGSDLEKKCSMKSYYYTILIFGHRIKDIIIAVEDKPVLL